MSTTVDINLITDLHRFGAADINACFSCGNCTAICPLSDNDATFPRRVIRLAQVGLKDDLVASKELWTCYHCGMCTDRCPQEADPAEFMATARRYAIAHFDKTRLARVMYTKPWLAAIIMVLAALVFAGFFASVSGQRDKTSLALFNFIPYTIIHTVGLVLIIVVAVFAVLGIVLVVRSIGRKDGVTAKSLFGGRKAWARTWRAFWSAVGIESLGQRRYRKDCDDDQPAEPIYRRRWLMHLLTVWGFLGLFLATLLDYGMDILGLKETGTPVPVWYPVRLLGTVAGLALMYGVSWLIVRRYQRTKRGVEVSTFSDWAFLVMLWFIGCTGFLIEIALYLPRVEQWGYWVFLVHVALAMELVLFLPFTKFAHIMYRPAGLFFYSLARS